MEFGVILVFILYLLVKYLKNKTVDVNVKKEPVKESMLSEEVKE